MTTPPCGAPQSVAFHSQSSRYPAFSTVPDEPQEPVIVDFLRQDRDHYLVVQRPEAVGDVSLDEPGRPGPDVFHLAQRGVAAAAGTETV